jgi:hypothetical protein
MSSADFGIARPEPPPAPLPLEGRHWGDGTGEDEEDGPKNGEAGPPIGKSNNGERVAEEEAAGIRLIRAEEVGVNEEVEGSTGSRGRGGVMEATGLMLFS